MKHVKIKQFSLIFFIVCSSAAHLKSMQRDVTGATQFHDEMVNTYRKKGDLEISDFGDFFGTVNIPQVAVDIFKKIKLTNIVTKDAPKEIGTGFVVIGSTKIGKQPVQCSVMVIDQKVAFGVSINLAMPKKWKLSELTPTFKKLDKLSLPNARLIVSNFDYNDEDLKTPVYMGLNFISQLDLTGPLAWLGKLIHLAKTNKALRKNLVIGSEDVLLQGQIDPNLVNSQFSATIPIQIGIDFTKIEKIPKWLTNVFKKITTDMFTLGITPPPNLSITLGTGIRITLGTQKEPLKLDGDITEEQLEASASQTLDAHSDEPLQMHLNFEVELDEEDKKKENKKDRKKEKIKVQITLDDIGAQITWDDEIMPIAAIFGIPFTGFGLRGTLYLGKAQDKSTSVTLAGEVNVKSGAKVGDPVPFTDLLLVGSARNFKFSTFVQYLAKLAKKNISLKKIPTFTISDMTFYLAVNDVWVAQKLYRMGLNIQGDVNILGMTGVINMLLDPKRLVIESTAYLSEINTKVFKLTGVGLDKKSGTKDDGPVMTVLVSATTPQRSGIFIDGTIEIPPIGLKGKTKLEVDLNGLKGNFETKVGKLFDTNVGIYLNPQDIKNMQLSFSFQQGFIDALTKEIHKGMEQAREDITKEINRLNSKLNDLKKELNQKKEDCKKHAKSLKFWTGDFWKSVDKCLETVSPGIKIGITNVEKGINKATKKTLKGIDEILSHSVPFEIRKVSGEVSGKELSEKKMPKVSLEIYIPILKKTMKIKDMQFDFNNPQLSIRDIAQKFVNFIKG